VDTSTFSKKSADEQFLRKRVILVGKKEVGIATGHFWNGIKIIIWTNSLLKENMGMSMFGERLCIRFYSTYLK